MEGFQEFQPFLGRHLQVDAVIDPPPAESGNGGASCVNASLCMRLIKDVLFTARYQR